MVIKEAAAGSLSCRETAFRQLMLYELGDNETRSSCTTSLRSLCKTTESIMSNSSAKIALALLFLATPAASFARMAGQAGAGNVPISGIPPGPANAGGLNNIIVDPSGIANASRLPPLSIPPVRVPQVPQFK